MSLYTRPFMMIVRFIAQQRTMKVKSCFQSGHFLHHARRRRSTAAEEWQNSRQVLVVSTHKLERSGKNDKDKG